MKTYKMKAPTLNAVEFTDALQQSPEIANMIGASSIKIDVAKATATFTVGKQDYAVAVGQVISIENGDIAVADSEDFYSKYEIAT